MRNRDWRSCATATWCRQYASAPAITQTRSGQPVQPSPHKIQGIGAGFIPEILDRSVIDEVIAIGNQAAFDTARALARHEGIPGGISSGAAVAAALERPASVGQTR